MFGTGLVIGLVGGMHCVLMCIPVVHTLQPKKTVFNQILYHTGRILIYVLLALAVGMIGDGLAWFGIQRIVSIVMGVIMILLTILPSARRRFYRISIQSPLLRFFRKWLGSTGFPKPLMAGALNGFLPCGLVYVALTGSLALGNMNNAALFMFGFGIGTVPWLAGAVSVTGLLPDHFKRRSARVVPVLAVMVGLLFILRGLALDIPYVSPVLQQIGLPEAMTTCG